MERKERDVFAEALELLRERRFKKYGFTAETIRAVRIGNEKSESYIAAGKVPVPMQGGQR